MRAYALRWRSITINQSLRESDSGDSRRAGEGGKKDTLCLKSAHEPQKRYQPSIYTRLALDAADIVNGYTLKYLREARPSGNKDQDSILYICIHTNVFLLLPRGPNNFHQASILHFAFKRGQSHKHRLRSEVKLSFSNGFPTMRLLLWLALYACIECMASNNDVTNSFESLKALIVQFLA